MTIKYGVLALAAAGALSLSPLALAQDTGAQPMSEEPMASPSAEMQAPEQQASLDPSMSEPQAGAQGESPFSEELVRGIQQALKDQGADVQVDGVWGPQTQQALSEYQQKEGIDAQGQINMETLSSLEVEDQEGSSQQAAAPSEEMPSESEQQAAAPSESESLSEPEQQAAAPVEQQAPMPEESQQATAPTTQEPLETEQQATAPSEDSMESQQATAPTE